MWGLIAQHGARYSTERARTRGLILTTGIVTDSRRRGASWRWCSTRSASRRPADGGHVHADHGRRGHYSDGELVAVSNLFDSNLEVLWRLGGDPTATTPRGLDGRDPIWTSGWGRSWVRNVVGSDAAALVIEERRSRGPLTFGTNLLRNITFGFVDNTMAVHFVRPQVKVVLGLVRHALRGGAPQDVITFGERLGGNARRPRPAPVEVGPWNLHVPGDLAAVNALLDRILDRDEDRLRALALFYLNPWHPGNDPVTARVSTVDEPHRLAPARRVLPVPEGSITVTWFADGQRESRTLDGWFLGRIRSRAGAPPGSPRPEFFPRS